MLIDFLVGVLIGALIPPVCLFVAIVALVLAWVASGSH